MDDGTFYLRSDADEVSEDFGVIGTRIVVCTVENNESESHCREHNADTQPAAELFFRTGLVNVRHRRLLLMKEDEPQGKGHECGKTRKEKNGIGDSHPKTG